MKKVYLVHFYKSGCYDETASCVFASLSAARLYADQCICETKIEQVDLLYERDFK